MAAQAVAVSPPSPRLLPPSLSFAGGPDPGAGEGAGGRVPFRGAPEYSLSPFDFQLMSLHGDIYDLQATLGRAAVLRGRGERGRRGRREGSGGGGLRGGGVSAWGLSSGGLRGGVLVKPQEEAHFRDSASEAQPRRSIREMSQAASSNPRQGRMGNSGGSGGSIPPAFQEACSSIVKLLPGNADLLTSQATWTRLETMLRVFKAYSLAYRCSANSSEEVPGRTMMFSSYPGRLFSGDDYYLISSGLTVQVILVYFGGCCTVLYWTVLFGATQAGTSTEVPTYRSTAPQEVQHPREYSPEMDGNANPSCFLMVWSPLVFSGDHDRERQPGAGEVHYPRGHRPGVDPQHGIQPAGDLRGAVGVVLPAPQQRNVQQPVDGSGQQTVYPGRAPGKGTLWVLEQLPGVIEADDVTEILVRDTYWASYDIPYFENIYNLSGFARLEEKYGKFFSYTRNARARLFKRDQGSVVGVPSLQRLMRYNDYRNDPSRAATADPPFSAELALAARGNLNARNGSYSLPFLGLRDHAETDTKISR